MVMVMSCQEASALREVTKEMSEFKTGLNRINEPQWEGKSRRWTLARTDDPFGLFLNEQPCLCNRSLNFLSPRVVAHTGSRARQRENGERVAQNSQ